jgi:hypothetical protein
LTEAAQKAAQSDPELDRLIEVWPDLPKWARTSILQLAGPPLVEAGR